MNPVAVGEFIGAFAIAIGVAAVWLIIAYVISPLRRRPQASHIVAMVLVAILAIIPAGGPSGASVGAAILCIALLYWQMKRAERKLVAKAGEAGSA
jgi:asparagine N-glycosylation enzyme membrane subunit Stt3